MVRITKKNGSESDLTFDDLTAIKGIREARQQWFRDTMKVRTYGDLAALSVDQIEAGLKAEKQFPSRTMIAAWIAQAKALTETEDQPDVPRKLTIEAPRWQPAASFVVEFQTLENEDGTRRQRTTIHHIETDKNQLWEGVVTELAMQWMLIEAGLEVETSSQTDFSEPILLPEPLVPAIKYSDKLQQVLAKSQALSHPALPVQIASSEVASAKPTNPPATRFGFSEQMQNVLSRTQNYKVLQPQRK